MPSFFHHRTANSIQLTAINRHCVGDPITLISNPFVPCPAPPDAGRQLYEAANDPRFLWEAENIQHLMIHLDNPRRYQRRLIGFFDEWLLEKE